MSSLAAIAVKLEAPLVSLHMVHASRPPWENGASQIRVPIAFKSLDRQGDVVQIRCSDKHCFFTHLPPTFVGKARIVSKVVLWERIFARPIRREIQNSQSTPVSALFEKKMQKREFSNWLLKEK